MKINKYILLLCIAFTALHNNLIASEVDQQEFSDGDSLASPHPPSTPRTPDGPAPSDMQVIIDSFDDRENNVINTDTSLLDQIRKRSADSQAEIERLEQEIQDQYQHLLERSQSRRKPTLLKHQSQPDSSASSSRDYWGPLAAFTSATAVAGSAAALKKASALRMMPMRSDPLTIAAATTGVSGASAAVWAGVAGGIALLIIGSGAAIITSLKSTFGNIKRTIQRAQATGALKDQQVDERLDLVEERINSVEEGTIARLKRYTEQFTALTEANGQLFTNNAATQESLDRIRSNQRIIIQGLGTLERMDTDRGRESQAIIARIRALEQAPKIDPGLAQRIAQLEQHHQKKKSRW